jgi:ASC-1-like (ASCH) protein
MQDEPGVWKDAAEIDVTHPKAVRVKVSDAESYEVIQAVKRKVPSRTWDRIVKTVDEAIESSIQIDGKLRPQHTAA